jgi:methylphosphotriester-DNA--protein-cysteine methyltransferase
MSENGQLKRLETVSFAHAFHPRPLRSARERRLLPGDEDARCALRRQSFFTAVTSTGIYCRPVCRVKLPRRENCRFFRHAAQAEAEGFRPCLRCRPELAPRAASWSTEDASRILALQAARLIDEPDAWSHGDGPAPARRRSRRAWA